MQARNFSTTYVGTKHACIYVYVTKQFSIHISQFTVVQFIHVRKWITVVMLYIARNDSLMNTVKHMHGYSECTGKLFSKFVNVTAWSSYVCSIHICMYVQEDMPIHMFMLGAFHNIKYCNNIGVLKTKLLIYLYNLHCSLSTFTGDG